MTTPGRPRGDDVARFWSKVDRRGDTECWPWKGALTKGGYARFRMPWGHVLAHRWAYERFVHPIPEGFDIDHVKDRGCVRRDCVNFLRHLEPVTEQENTLRGDSFAAVNARKTHCTRGNHPLSGPNLRIQADGGRVCRTCAREASHRYLARQRSARQEAAA